jgi:hypothetical protein
MFVPGISVMPSSIYAPVMGGGLFLPTSTFASGLLANPMPLSLFNAIGTFYVGSVPVFGMAPPLITPGTSVNIFSLPSSSPSQTPAPVTDPTVTALSDNPEPATFILTGLSLGLLAIRMRRKASRS